MTVGSIVAFITHICLFSQGGELARRSALLNGDSHLTHFYDDARTLYEFFLRGARVSSKSQIHKRCMILSEYIFLAAELLEPVSLGIHQTVYKPFLMLGV